MKILRSTPRFRPEVVLDSLSSAVLCVDGELCLANINAAAEVMFGVSARQVSGEDLFVAIPHLAPQREAMQRALTEGGSYMQRQLKLAHNGGEPFTVDLAVTPFAGFDGRPGLVLEMRGLDRHLRISMDNQISNQHQVSLEVLRGLAHEVKNPLSGLRGAAQLLQRELGSTELQEYTDIIIGEADRLKKLVDRLLGPNVRPSFATVNIHAILEEVRKLVQVDLPESVRIERDYDPSLPELSADADQLKQVFLNLCMNAVESVDEQGLITLRTRVRRQFTIRGVRHALVAQIDVADDGPGISEDMLPKIFYPMVTTRAEGTGLGLPMAQSLVLQHYGLIEAASRLGQTEFSVFLPITKMSEYHHDNN